MAYQCDTSLGAIELFSNPADPVHDLAVAIGLIEKATHTKSSQAQNLTDVILEDKLASGPLLTLKPDQEILIVTDDCFRRIHGLMSTERSYAGGYHPSSGRIFLVKDSWCYSNLIHEALHSRSAFSKIAPIEGLKFVFEGLTEFLVGIVLRTELKPCFDVWHSVDSCFLSPYLPYVKPWYYLSKQVDISDIISLYFNTDEASPYQRLATSLRNLTGSSFDIFTDLDKIGIFQAFKENLGKIYGKDFAQFQASVIDEINLDHLEKLKLFCA